MSALSKLHNLGPASAKMLADIGITTKQALSKTGSIGAYIQLKNAGLNPSINLIYAIEGALNNHHWCELTAQQRRQLRLELDAAIDINNNIKHNKPRLLKTVSNMSKSRKKTEPTRCSWALQGGPLDIEYHDKEWGVPCFNDTKLFEFLILEGAQAGLSWATILKKRAGYHKAFNQFDAKKIARYTPARIEKLLKNPDIIRNRLKINAAVTNARLFLETQAEFGSFANYIWQFVDGKPIQNRWKSLKQVPASTPQSDQMSKDLKKRGFKFVGTTICYAYMQAMGMVNDHTTSCFRYKIIRELGQ